MALQTVDGSKDALSPSSWTFRHTGLRERLPFDPVEIVGVTDAPILVNAPKLG
jgi:hypothetical protein